MKTYKSIRGINFYNLMACALDNESKKDKFALLFAFVNSNYPEALEEWRYEHNFLGCTYGLIEQTLLDIEVLNY